MSLYTQHLVFSCGKLQLSTRNTKKNEDHRHPIFVSCRLGKGQIIPMTSRRKASAQSSASPSFISSSPVSPRGIQWGLRPPWSSGKESRGNRLEIGSLWRVFAYFLHVEKVGRRRRRDKGTKRRGEMRIRNTPGESPTAVVPKTRRGLFALRRDPVSFSGKETGKRNRQREPIPKAVPFGILPHRPGGCGPLEIPRGLRGTMDEEKDRSPAVLCLPCSSAFFP